jgi:hypothetical protein
VNLGDKFQGVGALSDSLLDLIFETRVGGKHRCIDPPLQPSFARSPLFSCVALEDRKYVLPVRPKAVLRKPQPHNLRDRKIDIQGIFGDRPGNRGHGGETFEGGNGTDAGELAPFDLAMLYSTHQPP